MPEENIVHKGLEGVTVSETKVGFVDGEAGRLVYRGYNIEDLVENATYEEVSFLLINGYLPNKKELDGYCSALNRAGRLPAEIVDFIAASAEAYPTSVLRTAISYLGQMDDASVKPDFSQQREIAIGLIGKIPSLVATIQRARNGEKYIEPSPDLSVAGNILYQSSGKKPDKKIGRVMDVCLMLHADHGSNASTFSSMVTISTLSDMYSAVTAAVSTLKGPLHGGANEMALKMIKDAQRSGDAAAFISDKLSKKEKIMGFGHRVYKVYDPRARILKNYAREATASEGREILFKTAQIIEDTMISKLGSKGIFPNVDFYSGMVYESLGFRPEMFTSLFAASRITGWSARSLEYLADNKLFRPRSSYVGERGPLTFVPLAKRTG
ncbi:MAG: citrate/2-methylcitrate synthase [Candidatus Thermoplasmatota archaeon]|nr:citrate/2-methylcitrate synthase [Candidatus Thermoplasmatota archaeon]MCL5730691.1 citrate/2-methylcitrate synthase [Candidatus Thermoplasmatota archaeon]